MRDQQHNAEHERHDHQNGVQRLHLGQKNVDQPERTAKERTGRSFGIPIAICGKCFAVCPYTQRYLKNE